jgi:hypothetical protein
MKWVKRWPEAPIIASGLVFMYVVAIMNHQWFYADEWEFISTRSRPPLSEPGRVLNMLFTPHNEHWSTIPILIYRAVFGVVGLRGYWPYLILLYAFHLILVVLVVRLMKRCGVPVVGRCFAAAIFTVYGAGAENLLWAFQFAWIAACIAGLVLVELIDVPTFSRRRLVVVWLVGVAGLMCAGIGVSMVAAGALTAWIRHGWRRAVAVASVPAVVQLLWTAKYGQNSAPIPIQWSAVPHRAITYTWTALSSAFDRTTGLDGLGIVALAALVFALVRFAPQLRHTHAAALGLAGASVPLLLLIAVGRVDLDKPDTSRYAYVLFALVSPLAFTVLARSLAGAGRGFGWVASGVGALSVVTSVGVFADSAYKEGLVEEVAKKEVVAAFSVARSNFAAPNAIPSIRNADLNVSAIRRLLNQGFSPPGVPDPQDVASVIARTSIDVTPEPRVPLDGRVITIGSLGRVTGQIIESGCLGFFPQGPNPQVSLLPRRPASIKLVPLYPGTLQVTVIRDGRSAQANPVSLSANNPVFVNMADPRNEYVLTLPDQGQTKACGLGQRLP